MSGVTGIGSGLARQQTPENLKKAGEQFEATFTGMMLKSMRQAKLADPLFDSKAIDTFSEMQDAQITKAMAQHAPLGIGKAMTDFLQKSATATTDFPAKSQSNLNPDAAKPPK